MLMLERTTVAAAAFRNVCVLACVLVCHIAMRAAYAAEGGLSALERERTPKPASLGQSHITRLIVQLHDRHASGLGLSDSHAPRGETDAAQTARNVVMRVLQMRANGNAALRSRRATGDVDGVSVERAMSGQAHVVQLATPLSIDEAATLAQLLERQPEIGYAEPDYMMRAYAEPTDPLYGKQWGWTDALAGANFPAAWDEAAAGGGSVVVAVLDSGHRMHADLAANLLPGYDFILDASRANDGDGRDPDASDPGDWTTVEESRQCDGTDDWVTDSTWHGTHVMGTIGAMAGNGIGGVGALWQGRIVPVRVLGKCGARQSDVIDALRWAAGLPVPGVPTNPHPAKVVNISLGTPIPCGAAMQAALDDVIRQGVVVVAAAGNSNGEVGQPASCRGAIAVAAIDRRGEKASFSNFGARIDLGAPGVDIVSTSNAGKRAPAEDDYKLGNGTSMAAPHVTGAVALMLAANPTLTPERVRAKLIAAVRPYPDGSSCAQVSAEQGRLCGAGMLDAGRAMRRDGAALAR
ncbi:S8 family peptidase [Trinickia sp. LjRoot230]|uniref:S8 family peptidase n=1 Tax=Trinickia sp. LjRoot230 TaxID=3342288 RepID=UPI003ECEB824